MSDLNVCNCKPTLFSRQLRALCWLPSQWFLQFLKLRKSATHVSASRLSNFEITRAITPWIVLYSIQLLLLISGVIFCFENNIKQVEAYNYWILVKLKSQWITFASRVISRTFFFATLALIFHSQERPSSGIFYKLSK